MCLFCNDIFIDLYRTHVIYVKLFGLNIDYSPIINAHFLLDLISC